MGILVVCMDLLPLYDGIIPESGNSFAASIGQLAQVVTIVCASSADLDWYSYVSSVDPHARQDAIL